MCDFCENGLIIKRGKNNDKLRIVDEKFLVYSDNKTEHYFDLSYCPFCGKKLNRYKTEKIFVSNITKDEILDVSSLKDMPSEYFANPLHSLICDKTYEDGETEEQIGFIISESQVKDIKEKGYCYITCEKAARPFIY